MHWWAATALCLIGLSTTAGALGASEHASSVSFDFARGDATWKGRVASEASACERHREVVIKELQRGRDRVVVAVRADGAGRYWAHGDVEYTTYYAKVRAENVGARGIRCERDRSPSITIARADPG